MIGVIKLFVCKLLNPACTSGLPYLWGSQRWGRINSA